MLLANIHSLDILNLDKLIRGIAFMNLFKIIPFHSNLREQLIIETAAIIDLDKLLDKIIDLLQRHFRIHRIGIILKCHGEKGCISKYKAFKLLDFNETDSLALINDYCSAIDYLMARRRILTPEILQQEIANSQDPLKLKKLMEVKAQLEKLAAGACLPLFAHDEFNGLVIFGFKNSQQSYTAREITLLESLQNQISVAITNALLYQEVKEARLKLEDFNKNLQSKVDEQTRDLRELLEMKSEFLTVASHQLRTPTSVVRGYLSMAEESGVKAGERKMFIEQAYAGINRMERIIQEILSATELEGLNFDLEYDPISLKEMLEQLQKEFQPEADKKNIEIKTIFLPKEEPAETWALVRADQLKIHEALANIIENAINYSERGMITLTLSRLDGEGAERNLGLPNYKKYAKIEVQDNGIGFSERQQKHIGEKFYRTPQAVQERPNGSGLGLYISRKIIELAHGKLTIDSLGFHKGSSICIYLPL